jgi:hypothetical protein
MVNGPGLSGMPKKNTFGSQRAQALQMWKLNTNGTTFSRKIQIIQISRGKQNKLLKRRGTNTYLSDEDSGVSKEEELVQAGNEDNPNETNNPSTERR